MSAGLPDLERMALTLPRNRSAKPPLERTSSSGSTPENGRQPDEGTAQIRERPKAKMAPRGTGVRVPGVGGEAGESDLVVDRQQQNWSSPSKTSSSSPKTPSSSTYPQPQGAGADLPHAEAPRRAPGGSRLPGEPLQAAQRKPRSSAARKTQMCSSSASYATEPTLVQRNDGGGRRRGR
ncbi:hypothetical protein OYC64_021973 [Pagothenia borchgrevinki]|uniref:Uncharacterized protein n=1 Tax=Pagothenia borchgrevinki TaxID=8213 RepID=A0ABD2G1A4_PAGBO